MYKNRKRKTEKLNLDNCITCALYPLFKLALITGISSIIPSCRHLNKLKSKSRFYVYRNHIIVEILILSYLILAFLFHIHTIMNEENNFILLQSLAEVLYCINGIHIMITELFKRKWRISCLNDWAKNIQNCKQYHINVLLPNEKVRTIRKIGYFYCALNILSVIILIYWEIVAHTFESYWRILPTTANIIAVFIEMIIASELIACAITQKVIINAWQTILKKMLIEHLRKNSNNESTPLRERLHSMKKMFTALYFNYEHAARYLSPGGIYWFLFMLLILIINIYTSIILWTNNIYSDLNIVLQMKTYGIILIILQFAVYAQELEDINEDTLPFLFKYPISKLRSVEAAQIEMLIRTLMIQKLTIRVSNIFTVGTKLLASIAGTVITYVLVTLQFHESWAKK